MHLTKKWVARVMSTLSGRRKYSETPVAVKKQTAEKDDLSLIRNIGILAHIDAGKTTTTERMLFYSGKIGHMGEVHDGNTVTDFMDQERQRGITITAASVTFKWGKHNINLLDTPGHIDFTMEVEQTLNVMDGAVVILDGSAGVEAQTVTVWKQSDRYKIPRLIYVNKMDKTGAELFSNVNSIQKHLHVIPLVLQLPLVNKSKFEGVVDLLSLEKYKWDAQSLGTTYSQKSLTSEDGNLWEEAIKARIKLTETLADLDDAVAEEIIMGEKSIESVSSTVIRESVRKVTLEQKGVAVLCGSSYKNIGVQLLMNGILDYLPSPLCSQSQTIMECFGDNLSARAFKVRHDKYKGPITFFRIYSVRKIRINFFTEGNLSVLTMSGRNFQGQKVYNVKQEKTEHCGRLYLAYADNYEEVAQISAGNIAAVTGLKCTATGDMVTSSSSAFQAATKSAKNSQEVLAAGASIPDPVFFRSIEAPSEGQLHALETALSEIEREDPSLRVTTNNETGQTVLGGMGELHLEVIAERIRSEYKVDALLGPLQIAYKEALVADARGSHAVQHKLGSGVHSVSLTLSLLVTDPKKSGKLLLDKSPDCVDNISAIFPKHLVAVKNGIESALESGPRLFCPVTNVNVMLHGLEVGRGTSESIISSATCQCARKLLEAGGTRLLEPLMLVEITCDESLMETVINDLNRRRAELESTEARMLDVVVRALVPLSELLGYSKELRILTSGKANFSMEFHSLRQMNPEDEEKAIKSVLGTVY